MSGKRAAFVICLLGSLASLRRMDTFLPSIHSIEYDSIAVNDGDNIGLIDGDDNEPEIRGPIPHILWFTYKEDVLETKEPTEYYDNVLKIIDAYRSLWKEKDAPVRFLVDDNCTDLLDEVDKKEGTRLGEAFREESRGDLKADLCRVAAIYLHGGYYFDVDIEVVKPLSLHRNVSFSTVRDSLFGYFFQAFLAAIPGHPVVKENLQTLMEYYYEKNGTCFFNAKQVVGPCTLAKAWNQTSNRGYTRMLKEINLKWHGLYPNMTQRGNSDPCHWVVHDPSEMEVYFYSRILGSSRCW